MKRKVKGSGRKKVKQQRLKGGHPQEPPEQLPRLSSSGVWPQSWPARDLGARVASPDHCPNDPRRRLPTSVLRGRQAESREGDTC